MPSCRITTAFEAECDDGHGDPWQAMEEINETLEETPYAIVMEHGTEDSYRIVCRAGGDDV